MEKPASNLYFVKVWYDGHAYNGSQYQPGQPTVDGALVDALRDLEYLPRGPPHNDHFKVAGRTDKGVSALGAVFFLRLCKPLHPCELNDQLRAGGHPIMIWSVAALDAPANPRHAIYRTYKYFHAMARGSINIENVRKGLNALVGQHDFKGFSKAGIEPDVMTTRTLDTAAVEKRGDVLVFTFRSRGFLWEQVRRMVGFVVGHADDPYIGVQIGDVLRTGVQPNMAPAPPAGLILWDVQYGDGIRWEDVEGCKEHFLKALRARYVEAMTRSAMLDAAFSAFHEV